MMLEALLLIPVVRIAVHEDSRKSASLRSKIDQCQRPASERQRTLYCMHAGQGISPGYPPPHGQSLLVPS